MRRLPLIDGACACRSGTGAAASGLDAEFSRLEDKSDAGKMNVDQIEAFATELGIDAYSDVGILIISYHMAVETQGVITLEEFKRGMTKMGARSVAELKARLPTIRSDMQRDANFAPFYTWCYVYNCVPGQKSLQLDAVQALAPMVLSAYKPWPLLTEWTEFLGKQTKTLSKDTWTMTLDFIKNVKPDLSNYDDECELWRPCPSCLRRHGVPLHSLHPCPYLPFTRSAAAWPVLFDEFVEFINKKKKASA